MIASCLLFSRNSSFKTSKSQLKKLMSSIDEDFKVCDKAVNSLIRFTFAEERMLLSKTRCDRAKTIHRRTDIVCELMHGQSSGNSYRSMLRSAVSAHNKSHLRALK